MSLNTFALAKSKGLVLKVLIAIFVAFSAFVFGLMAVSANPIMIGLAVGLVGGSFLIAAPKFSVYLLLGVGLVMGALISFAGPVFGKLPWGLSLLGMLLFVPVFLAIVMKNHGKIPLFIWLAIIFMGYALVVTFVGWDSFTEALAGFKRYFQAYGLLLALAFLPFAKDDFNKWQKLLLAIALLQFPFALYELLVLVPQRGGLSTASYTTDVVAGTFGANLEGGSPGIIMAVFLLITFAFVFSRLRSGLINTKAAYILSAFLLLPLGMGESKIVVFLLPMVWLSLMRHDIVRAPIKYFPALLAGGLITTIFGYVYVSLIMDSTLSEVVEATISYNFADAGYGMFYLNRTTVLSFWWANQGMHDPMNFFFGNGLGSAFLGQISGHIGMKYPRYGIDLTAASTLLWDLGLIGLILFTAVFISAWKVAGKLFKESNDVSVKADALAIQAAISLFLVLIIYSQDIVNLIALEIIYSFVLGYLAYLYRVHFRSSKAAIS